MNKDGLESVGNGPVGIWGWNTLPILNLMFMVLGIVLGPLLLLGDTANAFERMDAIELMVAGAVAIPILVWAFKRDHRYPTACGYLFAGMAVVDIVLNVLRIASGFRCEPGGLRGIVFAIIWIAYFNKSVRIRNTYGANGKLVVKDSILGTVAPVGRSGLAVVAGCLGLCSIFPLLAPASLIVGIMALNDLKKHPEKTGKGRAWFAVVFGGLITAAMLVLLLTWLTMPRT